MLDTATTRWAEVAVAFWTQRTRSNSEHTSAAASISAARRACTDTRIGGRHHGDSLEARRRRSAGGFFGGADQIRSLASHGRRRTTRCCGLPRATSRTCRVEATLDIGCGAPAGSERVLRVHPILRPAAVLPDRRTARDRAWSGWILSDPSTPLGELNLPQPGTLYSSGAAVIYEGIFRSTRA